MVDENTETQIARLQEETADRELRLLGSSVVEVFAERLPMIGGVFAVLRRFEDKRRTERVLATLQEVDRTLADQRLRIVTLESSNEEALAAIIGDWLDRVEREALEGKRRLFRNYLVRILTEGATEATFELRREFLRILDSLSLLDCEILSFLWPKNEPWPVKAADFGSTADPDAVIGSTRTLALLGLLDVNFGETFQVEVKVSMSAITAFGRGFVEFCLVEGR